jgi:two-component system LytT family sensor kinase
MMESLAQTGEYSIFGLQRPDDLALARGRKRNFTLFLFIAATAVAALYSLEQYLRARLDGQSVPISRYLPTELISSYVWALMTPAVMRVARRYPLWGARRLKHWAVQLGAMGAFVLVHATVLTIAQHLLGAVQPAAPLPRQFATTLLTWLALDCLVFTMLVIANHAIVYYRVSKDRALRASQLEARLAQAQLQVLRMQLHPHFLFNTLHSISALMHKDVRRADSMMAVLSDLLRMSLQNVGAQEVPLQVELDFLHRFAEIMSLRFGDRLRVRIDVDPAARDAMVPNLFLQPLVENSIRHGIADRVEGGTVSVSLSRTGDMLSCEIVDDGRGLPGGGFKEGVGLSSTRARLAHLYGDRHQFSLRSVPGHGVRITMAIPYRAMPSIAVA